MEQVTYSKLNLKKNQKHLPKTAEKDLPTILYADIRTSGSKIHLSTEDPVPGFRKLTFGEKKGKEIGYQPPNIEGQNKDLTRCSYKSLSGVLTLIIVLLCCALGYTGYMVYNKIVESQSDLKKELCVTRSDMSGVYNKIVESQSEMKKELCVTRSDMSGDCRLCPNHWSLHGDQCYYLNVTDRTWSQSRDDCKEMGADLLVIKDQEQQKLIQRFLSVQCTDETYWIGLHRDGDVWRWVDGEQYNSSLFSIIEQLSGRCVYMTRSDYYQNNCMSTTGSICVKKSVRI